MILLALLLVLWAWFSRTRLYNAIRAAGSNERSAFLNRVSVLGTNVWAYGLSGFFAAAAGLYFATQTGAGQPTVGTQYVLPAIAAVVIGGTSLTGGRGTLIGTIVGALHPDADRRRRVPAQAAELLAVGDVGPDPDAGGHSDGADRVARRAGRRSMMRWLSSPSPILLAYAAALLLFVARQPLFAGLCQSGACRRRWSSLASFIGIVAIGQTMVIIGGGIDSQVPWFMNSAAMLVTGLAHGQNVAAGLDRAADPASRAAPLARSTASALPCCGCRRSS